MTLVLGLDQGGYTLVGMGPCFFELREGGVDIPQIKWGSARKEERNYK